MFGNLKNKLGEVADLKKYATPQNITNSLMGSRQRSGSQTPSVSISQSMSPSQSSNHLSLSQLHSSTNHQQQNTGNYGNGNTANEGINNTSINSSMQSSGSATPRQSFSHSPLSPASSRSHSRQPSITSPPLSPGLSPTPATQLDNGSVSPSIQVTSKQQGALSREVVKLRAALEQQQDAHLSRLQSRDDEWRKKFARHADKVSGSQDSMQKSEIIIASLRKELDSSNDRANELAQRLQHVQEDCDELEGLSVQEAAKIKHMLLNTSSELEATRGQLSERRALHSALEQQMESQQLQRTEHDHQMELKLKHLQQEVIELQACRQQHLRNCAETGPDDQCQLQEQQADREQSLMDKVSEWRGRCEAVEATRSTEQRANQDQQRALGTQLQHATEEVARLGEQLERSVEQLQSARSSQEQLQEESRQNKRQEDRRSQEQQSREEQLQAEVMRLKQDVSRLNNDKEEVRWKTEEQGNKQQEMMRDLQQQLVNAVSRCSEATQRDQAARSAQVAADTRCADLQHLLQEVQERTQAQASVERANSERLQEVLLNERAQKQALETVKEELETKIKVYGSEKSKLSAHLDEYVAKVSVLEQQLQEQVLAAAHLHEQHDQLQQTALEYKEKMTGYESGALAAQQLERSGLVQQLQATVQQLQEDLQDKKQALKVQSQRMADMKKTMQREFRISPEQTGQQQTTTISDDPAVLPVGVRVPCLEVPAVTRDGPVDPINLEYLKHVVIKFVTSREYEAAHLTRAMATLLHLSVEEEKLLHDTLSWRMSWWGPKPALGKGQSALHIPPST